MNRSSSLKCKAVKSLGPNLAEASILPGPLAHHAATCLRCQAEVARFRRLRRELSSLADHIEPAPSTLVERVEQAIWADAAPIGAQHHGAKVVATIAGATAAAASVVAVALWRRARAAA
ncbi:MAG: hypothetical protein GY720_19135 [bacterium]|nr:hypothetical protein [bacterium]